MAENKFKRIGHYSKFDKNKGVIKRNNRKFSKFKKNRKLILKSKIPPKKPLPIYHVYISITPNNCFATLATRRGKVLFSCSGGNAGFKGPRRASPTCAFRVGCEVSNKLTVLKNRSKFPFETYIVLKSPINKRVRSLINGLMHYFDLYTGIINKFVRAHNGVRAPNVRRV